MRRGRISEVPAGGVQYALWFACTARGVQNEKRIFRIHRLCRTYCGRRFTSLMPPHITPLAHAHLCASPLDNQYFLHRRRTLHGQIGVGLHRDIKLSAAHAGVLCNDGFASESLTRHQTIRTERAKDYRMHRANPCAGQHGDREFRDHLHVNTHAITLADPHRLECVGHALYFSL